MRGVLVVEHVERVRPGFGNELFVGIRATREFGPVLAAGLGGIDTEYLADKMKPGVAVAKVAAMDTSAEEFLELFAHTAAYEILAGHARGRRRIVSDGELLRCFRAFLLLARKFCVDRGTGRARTWPSSRSTPSPSAGRRSCRSTAAAGWLRTARAPPSRRGPSRRSRSCSRRARSLCSACRSTTRNFGRIILENVLDSGFPREHLHVVKPGAERVLDVPCVPSVSELPEAIDLLVIVDRCGDAATGQVAEEVDRRAARSPPRSSLHGRRRRDRGQRGHRRGG